LTDISAHRGGSETAPAETYDAYRAALESGAYYLEFDVRRTADGTLVASHQARFGRERDISALTYATVCDLAGHEVPKIAALLRLLAGRAAAHVDLKEPECADAVVELALSLVDPADIVVTTREAAVVHALKQRYPAVPGGLTMGGDLAEKARFALRRARDWQLSPLDDVAAAGADVAVMHHRLATTRLLADCRKLGIQTMIWTVNSDRALARWLARPDVDVLVTDRPARAADRARLVRH
jgi:glycerophosphoryl diester phosphodiesterase